jgi:hypothetical protein
VNPIIPSNRVPLLLLFLALIVTFLVTRGITVRIRRGGTDLRNWSIAGVHIHHYVFGILIMLVVGASVFSYAPTGAPLDALAALFGVGASLTLDEFALWLRLDDVYWTDQGRASIDAVFVAVAVTALVLVGVTPFDLSVAGQLRLVAIAYLAANLGLTIVTFFKGKPMLGSLGIMIPGLSLIGAIRLGKPASQWAHWRYPEGSARLTRARQRFGAGYDARWNRVRDFFGRMSPQA